MGNLLTIAVVDLVFVSSWSACRMSLCLLDTHKSSQLAQHRHEMYTKLTTSLDWSQSSVGNQSWKPGSPRVASQFASFVRFLSHTDNSCTWAGKVVQLPAWPSHVEKHSIISPTLSRWHLSGQKGKGSGDSVLQHGNLIRYVAGCDISASVGQHDV